MTRKEKKQVQQIANYILNNITMAEILTVLAQKSTEIAEKMVEQKLSQEDYKKIIVSNESEFDKKVSLKTDQKDGWWVRLLKKIKFIKEPPPPAPKPKKPAPKKIFTGKRRKRMKRNA